MVSPIYEPVLEVLYLSVITYKIFLLIAVLRPQVGGRYVAPWSLFSSGQVYRHGLWCQVNSTSNANMSSNIGDMFYPTGDGPDGFTVASASSSPFRQLKCTNQIGIIVVTNTSSHQGIVKCNTTISNLDTDTNYWAVYLTDVFNSYSKLALVTINFSYHNNFSLYSWSHSGLNHDTLHTLIKRC